MTRDPGRMTGPNDTQGEDRNAAADLCGFAPLGLVSQLPGLIPRMVQRGRGQIKLARAAGRFVVEHSPLGDLPALRDEPDEPPRPAVSGTTPAVSPVVEEPGDGAPTVAPSDAASSDASVDALAIPDYDSLSASQVIPRLQGLEPDELEAVRVYEAGARSRRTILNKIAQLQSPGP